MTKPMTLGDIKVGDRVRHLYPKYETGKVVRIDDPDVNPYCVLVKIDGKHWGMGASCFKPKHLEKLKEDL